MKLILNKKYLNINLPQLLRLAGYSYHEDRRTSQGSFSRVLGGGRYPRLHLYSQENDQQFILNLHLDQKQASYAGYNRHSGEYEGEVIEQEITRLKQLIVNLRAPSSTSIDRENKTEDKANGRNHALFYGQRKLEETPVPVRSKVSWWKKIFNI